MKLKQITVAAIIALISVALLGLLVLQVVLLNRAYQLEVSIFQQNVNSALSSIVQKLETLETVSKIFKVTVGIDKAGPRRMAMININTTDTLKAADDFSWVGNSEKFKKVRLDSGKIIFKLDSPQYVRLRIVDSLGQQVKKILDEKKPAGMYAIAVDDSFRNSGLFYFNFSTDNENYVLRSSSENLAGAAQNISDNKTRRLLVDKVLENLGKADRVPIGQRINAAMLDTVVTETLREKGIAMPHVYGVISAKNDSLVIVSDSLFQTELAATKYRTRLFPHDVFIEENDF